MAEVVRGSLGFWIRRSVSGGEVHLERRWLGVDVGVSAGRGRKSGVGFRTGRWT
jgi:hypothetical protein